MILNEVRVGGNLSIKGTLNSRLVDLIDLTLGCESANSKIVEVLLLLMLMMRIVLLRVGNSLLQLWKLRSGHKAKLLFRL